MLYDIEQQDGKYQHTSESIKEIIKCIEEKQYFFENYIKIKTHNDGLIPLKLNKAQQKFLSNLDKSRNNICTTPRQSGMTTFLAADCLHDLIFKQYNTIAYVGPKLNFTPHFTHIIAEMIKHLPECLYDDLSVRKHEIRIDSNRLVCFGANKDTCRGMAVSRLLFDNVSYASQNKIESCWESIYPCISASKFAKVTFVDTPPLDYMQKFQNILHMDNVNRFSLSLTDLGMDEDRKDEIKKNIGSKYWHQEYEICWGFNN